ncbi:MAG TPA: helix-turn-helix domain-containing protein [Solirubrobacteraceae bacterium]|nr:helix-turn-helix domain-containing protein [Solirubrobacteraceae bacterium]
MTKLIDRIRHDIQQRLEQLLAEADKLRHALVALDPRERGSSKPTATRAQPPVKRTVSPPATAQVTPAPARAGSGAAAAKRTRPGETTTKVLAALSRDQGSTAGEVAKATGLARPTVSTTLSRLAKTGAVVKADRGYRLPGSAARP